MRYFIEATDTGYRFGAVLPSGQTVRSFERAGGHDKLEKLYAEAEVLYDELRRTGKPLTTGGHS